MAAYSSAQELVLNRTRVLHRLDQLSRKAEEQGQLRVAVRCEELIGKELGMFVERVNAKHQILRADDVSEEVLAQLIERAKEEKLRLEAKLSAGSPTDSVGVPAEVPAEETESDDCVLPEVQSIRSSWQDCKAS